MKPIYTFILYAVVVACTPQPKTDSPKTASTQAVVIDTTLKSAVDKVDVPAVTESVRQPITAVAVKPQKKDPSKKTIRCVYQTYEAGDCPHIIFDCADFGAASTASLPANQAKVWNDLLAFDGHGDFPIPNKKYVGKTFEIVYDYADAAPCPLSSTGETAKIKAPNILSFKLIAN